MKEKAPRSTQPPIEVDVQQLLYAVVNAAAGSGLVPQGEMDFAKERASKPLVVVAATPKAGSTFLVNTLIRITGLRGFRLCAAYSTNEHDLYLPALCLMNRYGCVSQLHMKGTFHNAALMRTFGIKPVILVRRIEDIVVSLQHDLKEKRQRRSLGTGRSGYSFVWQDQSTKELSDERLLDMIIDLAVPWFVNFYLRGAIRGQGKDRAEGAGLPGIALHSSDRSGHSLAQIPDFPGWPRRPGSVDAYRGTTTQVARAVLVLCRR
ncbi:MAG: hypothetical protein E6H46_03705 [Betaproteobacteria bacterium]|nr:MAG: hypothetical protein E6H46_03705 [Betaproteobacteria bacterium]